MLRRFRQSLVVLLLVVATVGCDRVTKHLAVENLAGEPTHSFLGDTIRLTYAQNTGGFLSLGAGLPPALRTGVFTIATGVILLLMAALAWRERGSLWHAAAFSLFVAGGASNWFDRVNDGSVVDFLNVGIGWLRTGIFSSSPIVRATRRRRTARRRA